MALRIFGPDQQQATTNSMMPQMQAMSEPVVMEDEPSASELGKVEPTMAFYRTPDMGPFMCGNCTHFREGGSCVIVAGPIEPEGMCNLFTPGESDVEEPAEEMEEAEQQMSEAEPEEAAETQA
jgi:hypothetical protein